MYFIYSEIKLPSLLEDEVEEGRASSTAEYRFVKVVSEHYGQVVEANWNPKTQKPFQDLKKSFKEACLKAMIGKMRFHDLRDNFATALVENGVDIVTISKLLGHSDINITVKKVLSPVTAS